MTQEEKDLLLKDLCSRIPYGVWIEQKLKSCKFGSKCMLNTRNAFDIYAIERGQYDFYKPYLFPLSSMTEEQKEEWKSLLIREAFGTSDNVFTPQDFYCKYHFDYHGLIPKGLANDATGLNIY